MCMNVILAFLLPVILPVLQIISDHTISDYTPDMKKNTNDKFDPWKTPQSKSTACREYLSEHWNRVYVCVWALLLKSLRPSKHTGKHYN